MKFTEIVSDGPMWHSQFMRRIVLSFMGLLIFSSDFFSYLCHVSTESWKYYSDFNTMIFLNVLPFFIILVNSFMDEDSRKSNRLL